MNYRIQVGNDYTDSRLLTAEELDSTLEMLRDRFGDRLSIMTISAEAEA